MLALTDKNKEALENCTELWDEIKNETEAIRRIETIKYEKDFIRIKFESNDDLPLGKILDIPVCVVVIFCMNVFMNMMDMKMIFMLFYKC